MDKYHDIDVWASRIVGSQHDGECCANCLMRFSCQTYIDGVGVQWCVYWRGEHGTER